MAVTDPTEVEQEIIDARNAYAAANPGVPLYSADLVDTAGGASAPDATTSTKGIVELATDAEVIAGVDSTRVVTAASIPALVTSSAIAASSTAKGVVELATDAEVATGTSTVLAVTPASLAALVATEVAKGIVQLATTLETQTGSNNSKSVTPQGANATFHKKNAFPDSWIMACSDETTAISATGEKFKMIAPYAMVLTGARIPFASVNSASATGTITIDIEDDGVSVLSTPITIEATEVSTLTSVPPVLNSVTIAAGSVVTVDVDNVAAGTATGLKVLLHFFRDAS